VGAVKLRPCKQKISAIGGSICLTFASELNLTTRFQRRKLSGLNVEVAAGEVPWLFVTATEILV